MQDKEIRIFYRGVPRDPRYVTCRAQSTMICDERFHVDPEALIGPHMLSGVDYMPGANDSPAELRFVLDGVAFAAIEDPSDGYRSMLDGVFFCKSRIENTFPAVRVELSRVESETDNLYRMTTTLGDVVVEFGTENADDYYPCFVSHFNPHMLGKVPNEH